MDIRSTNQRLGRRLLGQYLLFGLTSIVVLAAGMLLLSRSLLKNGEERDLITRVNDAREMILADQSRNRGTTTQTLVGLLGMEDWVAYAGVVSKDGKFIAHSKPSRVGQASETHPARHEARSVIERHVVWNDGRSIREYWAPLQSANQDFGSLQIGVAEEPPAGFMGRFGDWLPVGLLAPIAVLFIGAVFLRGAARTNSAIEDQLYAVSAGQPLTDLGLKPLAEPSPLATGWNRLIESVLGRGPASSLETKLSRSLGDLHEKRAERILSSLSEGVALTDQDGCITYVNRAFSVLLRHGGDESKLRGRPIRDLFPQGANLQLNPQHESRPAVFEVLLGAAQADGVIRVARNPMVRDEHAPMQHLWTIRDITQQKLADEMRTQFVYSATHELRTPLANIKAYAETLTMDDVIDPERQKGFLNTINSEATRLGRFVEELLNVSQMEAGAMTMTRTAIDLERLLTEAADKVRPQLQQKKIAFDVLMPPKLPKVPLDKDRFMAALVNLLGNAAKYTPDGGRVTFETIAGPKEIQISVKDTGFGISREELPKLFSKFFRSADDRVRDVPGSGLGLSFSQEVVRLHGGKLLVQSELNKGSQFTIVLPIST